MQTYAEFRPTAFDRRGAFLDDDRRAWYVLPVTRTRDSGTFDQSNFETALRILGGESETCEVHRFGHWGPGWFEIILVHPERTDRTAHRYPSVGLELHRLERDRAELYG